MKSYKIKKYFYADVRSIDGDIIPQGEKSSVCLSCSQGFTGFTGGGSFFEENTNKPTELIVSVMNKTADLLIGIKSEVFWVERK
jgi:hypothetical protein